MSLLVWLPLTKDLRQQGLSSAIISNNGATTNTAGKLGSCYSFNGSSNYLYTTGQGYFGNNYSFAAWVYTTSTSATQTIGCIRTAVGNGFSLFLISGKLRIDAGGTSSAQWTTSYTYPANTWFHLTVTYDGANVKYYINGVYQQSHAATISSTYWGNTLSFGASQANGSNYGNYLNGKLNDIRIYDHCLSPMEVKQISQGLVLHYPLNNQSCGNDNLFNANDWEQTDTTVIEPITCNSMYIGQTSYLENKNQYSLGSGHEDLIFSCDCETISISNSSAYFYLYSDKSTSYRIRLTEIGFKQKIILNIPAAATKLYFGTWGYSGRVKLTNIKLEKGTEVTPYCPNVADEFYSNIEYDCSGFCNNGTWHGSRTHTLDTPKYTVSTTATGSGTTYLEGPVLPAEAKTVALWIKNTSKSSNGAIFNDKTTGLQIGLLNSLLYMNSKTSTAGFTTTHWVNGEWNHVVAINNNGTRSLYVNGQAETQSGASNYYIHNADNCWLWNRSYNNSYPFTGSLCDLRVYTTALSADDVKSLYQNCATIDPDGTIRGQIRS